MKSTQISKSVCFLFGAGAETSYGLPLGGTFVQDILFDKASKDSCSFFNSGKPNFQDIRNVPLFSSSAHAILYQTIMENPEKWKQWFSEEERKTIEEYLNYKHGKSDDSKSVRSSFGDLYRKRVYEKIKNYEGGQNGDDLLRHINFYSYLDSKFNYLRFPETYPKECNKVMRFLFGAFYSLVKNLFVNGKSFDFGEMSSKDERNKHLLFSQFLSEAKPIKSDKSGYYETINKHKNRFRLSVVTTNYTKLAQEKIGLESKSVAYIHGRLDLFEDLVTKEVKEVEEFKGESNIIFPFLFIPSGVKPVVHPLQIKELEKATSFISKSDRLFVLGLCLYGADEHIRTMLKERMNQGKKVDVLIYSEKTDFQLEKARVEHAFHNKANKWLNFIEIKNPEAFEKVLLE